MPDTYHPFPFVESSPSGTAVFVLTSLEQLLNLIPDTSFGAVSIDVDT